MSAANSDVRGDTNEVRVIECRLLPDCAGGRQIHETDYVTVPVTAGEMTIVARNSRPSSNRKRRLTICHG